MKTKQPMRIVALLLTGLMLFASLPMAMAGDYVMQTNDYRYVSNPKSSDRLNLRADPSSTAPSQGKYYNGVAVYVQGPPHNGWVPVIIDGTNVFGYMQESYLSYTPVASVIPYATVRNNGGTGLNIREGRSLTAGLVDFVPNNGRVEVLGVGSTWHHVRYNGRTGFMLASKLLIDGSSGGGISPNPKPSTVPDLTPIIATAIVTNPNPSDRLNLRDSVSANGKGGFSMGKYYTGVQVNVHEYLDKGGVSWAMVSIGNRFGFMQMDYLIINGRVSDVRSAIPVVRVSNPNSADRLNLRAEPKATAASLGKYGNGTNVEVLGVINNTWCHVRVDGQIGFMMSTYLVPQPTF